MKQRNILVNRNAKGETISPQIGPAEEPVDSKTGHSTIQSEEHKGKQNEKEWRKPVDMDTTKSNPQLTAEEEKEEKGKKVCSKK